MRFFLLLCSLCLFCFQLNAQIQVDVLIAMKSYIQDGIYFQGNYYFQGYDTEHGYELWKTDGTPAGTVLLKDISPGLQDSSPTEYVIFNEVLYFFASDVDYGMELWRSDGTGTGTFRITDSPAIYLHNLKKTETKLIFTCQIENEFKNSLWFSDGTIEGTTSFFPTNETRFQYFSIQGDEVIIASATGSNSFQLWKTNGTPEGTVFLKGINEGVVGSNIRQELYFLNGICYLTSFDGTNRHLWRTDGTTEGTYPVAKICDGSCDNLVFGFHEINGYLYFTGGTTDAGLSVFRTDGTTEGTSFLFDPSAEGFSGPFNYTHVKDKIFYLTIVNSETEVWMSKDDGDQTSNKKLHRGKGLNFLAFPYKDQFYFTEEDSTLLIGLWKSDGTLEGTVRVGQSTPYQKQMKVINNSLYWLGYDPGSKIDQLWKTDGVCTRKLMDLPGYNYGFLAVGNNMILKQYNESGDQTLYYYELNNEPDLCESEVTAVENPLTNSYLFPNPTQGPVNLNYNIPILNIVVKDILGKSMYCDWSDKNLDLSSLQSGIYLVEIRTFKGSKSFRIMKE